MHLNSSQPLLKFWSYPNPKAFDILSKIHTPSHSFLSLQSHCWVSKKLNGGGRVMVWKGRILICIWWKRPFKLILNFFIKMMVTILNVHYLKCLSVLNLTHSQLKNGWKSTTGGKNISSHICPNIFILNSDFLRSVTKY